MSTFTPPEATIEATTAESTNSTPEVTTTEATTKASTDQDGMSAGMMAGIVIGAIVAVCVIVFIMIVIIIRYRAKQRKESEKYEQTKKKLKIDKLPSPSEIESAEIRPLERKPTKDPEIEVDLSSSTNHYQNVPNTKYENVGKEVQQPIYMEPKGEDKRIYNTAEGSEYYLVGEGQNPKLPDRHDETKQKHNVTKPKNKKGDQSHVNGKNKQNKQNIKPSQTKVNRESSGSSGSDSDTNNSNLNSSRDYINLKENPIAPPEHIAKELPQNLVVDEVYENEEVKNSKPSKIKR